MFIKTQSLDSEIVVHYHAPVKLSMHPTVAAFICDYQLQASSSSSCQPVSSYSQCTEHVLVPQNVFYVFSYWPKEIKKNTPTRQLVPNMVFECTAGPPVNRSKIDFDLPPPPLPSF